MERLHREMTHCLYPLAEIAPLLPAGTVHIWCATLDQPPAPLAIWEESLSADEMAGASRLRFSRHRRRYVAAHGILRELLAHYLEERPQSVDVSYSEYGKPYINGNLEFNMSHSADIALLAFCRNAELGIDVEKIRVMTDAGSIAARFFAPAEYERYQLLPAPDRQEAFFACWTRKEAFIKALGQGLSYPLDAFEVSFEPGQPVQLLRIRGREYEAQRWSLYDVTPLAGYAAALAIEGRGWQLSCHQYTSSDRGSV